MAGRVPVLYTEKDTFLHRLDPRTKVIMLVLSFVYVLLAPSWRWMAGLVAVGALTAVVARLPKVWTAVLLLLQLPNILGLIGLPALFQLVFEGSVTWEGSVQLGVTLALAWLGTLLLSSALFSSMRLEQLTDGMRGLKLPEVACFAVQYVFLLLYVGISDIMRILDSMKVRGFRLETRNPLTLAREMPHVMVPALFTIVRRANTMTGVLRMRGYARRERRSPVSLGRFRLADGASLAGATSALAVLVAYSPESLLGWG